MLKKVFKVSKVSCALDRVAWQKMKMSSAKQRWLTEGIFLTILAPMISPSASLALRRRAKISMQMMKSMGDRGSPCLSLLKE